MSDHEELAAIVAGLRRAMARFPASDAELLARAKPGAGAARVSEPVVSAAIDEPARPASIAATPASAPRPAGKAAILASALPEPRAVRAAPASCATPSDLPDGGRATEPSAPPAALPDLDRSAPVAADLFGPPTPAFVFEPPRTPAVALAPDLEPGGLAERAAIVEASLPILDEIATEVCACTRCGLSGTRTCAVPGTGTATSGIVFVGEAPGADEDRQGKPFVGRAGELLTRMIHAMETRRLLPEVPLDRETMYICNVLKCRPPENRNPLPHEVEACSPYLMRQLEALKPRLICCLGKFAAELLLGVKGTIAGMRGRVYRWRGSKLIVTYHPAACLRNPNLKALVWEDLQLLAREYRAD